MVTFKYLVCICSVGDHQFDEFEKNHPEMTGGGYEFNDRSQIILIPSSANFPKVLSRKKNGFEKIVRYCFTGYFLWDGHNITYLKEIKCDNCFSLDIRVFYLKLLKKRNGVHNA